MVALIRLIQHVGVVSLDGPYWVPLLKRVLSSSWWVAARWIGWGVVASRHSPTWLVDLCYVKRVHLGLSTTLDKVRLIGVFHGCNSVFLIIKELFGWVGQFWKLRICPLWRALVARIQQYIGGFDNLLAAEECMAAGNIVLLSFL